MITQLSLDGYGSRRYGSFAGKAAGPGGGPHPVGKITQLSLDGYGFARYGSFAGRAPRVSAVDTHDGFDSNKKRYARQIEQRARLRTQLEESFERAFASAEKVRPALHEVRGPELPCMPVDDDDDDDVLLLIL